MVDAETGIVYADCRTEQEAADRIARIKARRKARFAGMNIEEAAAAANATGQGPLLPKGFVKDLETPPRRTDQGELPPYNCKENKKGSVLQARW